MRRYLVRRLLQAIPILLGVSVVVFAIIHLAPGDPFAFLLDPKIDPRFRQQMMERLGLNQPLPIQYLKWLGEAVTGNLGYSIRFERPVTEMIAERIGPTFLLTGTALGLTLLLAIPIGVVSALRQYSLLDYAVTTFSVVGISLPSFFFALVMIFVFGAIWPIFPLSHMSSPPNVKFVSWWGVLLDRLHHLILPAVTVAVRDVAAYARFTRSSMLEVIRQDYVRTARSKGLAERVVVFKHAFRNGMIPIVTLLGLSLPALLSGVVIIEILFSWPGMGQLALQAVYNFDYPVLMGSNVFFALLVIIGNLAADVSYALVDPRIRYT